MSLVFGAALYCGLPQLGCADTCAVDPCQSRFEPWFDEYEANFDGPFLSKYRNYFDIYEQQMARFRHQEHVRMLELGVRSGGSLRMWKEYFGDALELHGIDTNPNSKIFEDTANNVHVHTGSLADTQWLHSFAQTMAPFDIILDGASHRSSDKKLAFEVLYSIVQPFGVYIVEDRHASYWPHDPFNVGVGVATTFVEHCKQLIDALKSFDWDSRRATDIARTTYSLTFYDSVIVINKRPHAPAEEVAAGSLSVPDPLQEGMVQNHRAHSDALDSSVKIHVSSPDLNKPVDSPVQIKTQVFFDPAGPLARDVLAAPDRWWTCAQIGDMNKQCIRADVTLGRTAPSSSSVEDAGPVTLSVATHSVSFWLERRAQLAEWSGVDRVAAKWSRGFHVGELDTTPTLLALRARFPTLSADAAASLVSSLMSVVASSSSLVFVDVPGTAGNLAIPSFLRDGRCGSRVLLAPNNHHFTALDVQLAAPPWSGVRMLAVLRHPEERFISVFHYWRHHVSSTCSPRGAGAFADEVMAAHEERTNERIPSIWFDCFKAADLAFSHLPPHPALLCRRVDGLRQSWPR